MVNTYNFLKNAYQDTAKEIKQNPSFFFLLLVALSIPMPLAITNIVFGLFVLTTISTYKKQNLSSNTALLLPIGLYFLMLLSLLWTTDSNATIKSLSKEVFLLILPICFILMPKFDDIKKEKLLKIYSYAMALLSAFFIVRALIRFLLFSDTTFFFYHGENDIDSGLVPKLLNAIHVSIFVAIAFFYFLKKENKTFFQYGIQVLLFVFLVLLSSKNIIVVILLLTTIFYLYFSNIANTLRLRNLFIFIGILVLVFSFGKLKQRFDIEINTNSDKSLNSSVVNGLPQGVHNISISEAWSNEKFTSNDYFNGTAFRVYQFRMFLEIMSQNNKWITGFGLGASQPLLENKGIEYQVYLGDATHEGYQKKNFHNQYLQIFAELGFFGLLLLVVIVTLNLKKAIKSKDFLHIAFSILMISLFLTESFLWRQRGVMFFTLMYCIFNVKEHLSLSKTE